MSYCVADGRASPAVRCRGLCRSYHPRLREKGHESVRRHVHQNEDQAQHGNKREQYKAQSVLSHDVKLPEALSAESARFKM